jgi:hypothetical protein
VAEQFDAVAERLEPRFARMADMLRTAAPELTAFAALPPANWRKIWSVRKSLPAWEQRRRPLEGLAGPYNDWRFLAFGGAMPPRRR